MLPFQFFLQRIVLINNKINTVTSVCSGCGHKILRHPGSVLSDIPSQTLKDIDNAIANFKLGQVSQEVDLSDFQDEKKHLPCGECFILQMSMFYFFSASTTSVNPMPWDAFTKMVSPGCKIASMPESKSSLVAK